jgi:hypothetical protein
MKKSQRQMFYEASRRISDADQTMMELLFGVNPITDEELRKAIAKRPSVYKRYEGYIGRRANAVFMPCCHKSELDRIYDMWSNPFPGSDKH